jgi:hypothetical protein
MTSQNYMCLAPASSVPAQDSLLLWNVFLRKYSVTRTVPIRLPPAHSSQQQQQQQRPAWQMLTHETNTWDQYQLGACSETMLTDWEDMYVFTFCISAVVPFRLPPLFCFPVSILMMKDHPIDVSYSVQNINSGISARNGPVYSGIPYRNFL